MPGKLFSRRLNMETQLMNQRASRQNDSSDASAGSAGLSEMQASCHRVADAAAAEIAHALKGDVEGFLDSAKQMRGAQ
jgi:hypothetical protein